MSFPTMTDDVEIISKLGDEPNEDDGLTAAELKAKFDEAGRLCKAAINALALALEDSDSAGSLGFQRSENIPADNVQAAIENLLLQMQGITQDGVANGSITGAKLAPAAVEEKHLKDGVVSLDKLGSGCFLRDITEEMDVTVESASHMNPASCDLEFFYSPLLRMVFVSGEASVDFHTGQHPSGAYIRFGSADYMPQLFFEGVSVLNDTGNCDGFAKIAPSVGIRFGVSNVAVGETTPRVKIHGWYICDGPGESEEE